MQNFVYKAGFWHLSFQIAEEQHGYQNVKYASAVILDWKMVEK